MKYAKAIVAGLSVAIAAAIPLVADNSVSVQDVLIVVGAGLAGSFPTWAIPNEARNEDGVVTIGPVLTALAVVLVALVILSLVGHPVHVR